MELDQRRRLFEKDPVVAARSDNKRWFRSSSEEDCPRLPERWVAISLGRVVAEGENLRELQKQINTDYRGNARRISIFSTLGKPSKT